MTKSDRYDVRKYSYEGVREEEETRNERVFFSLIISRGKDTQARSRFQAPSRLVSS